MYTIELPHLTKKERVTLIKDMADLGEALSKCAILSAAIGACGLDHLAIALVETDDKPVAPDLATKSDTTH